MNEPVFKLSRPSNAPISDKELTADLRRVANILGTDTVSNRQYQSLGQYAAITQSQRFGSWNDALRQAGLSITNRMSIPDEELFENILTLWHHYGRQPMRRECS